MSGVIEHLIIDGQRVAASDGATLDVHDPSSGGLLARAAKAIKADVKRAVRAARTALESTVWGDILPAERGRILLRITQAIRERAEKLANLESRDNGKPLRQARNDVHVAARYFEFFGGAADKIMGNTIPLGPGFLDFTLREPIGVSAQIVPWNYPIQIGSRGLAPALAAGCTVVFKPSSEAPMTALRLGEIALTCGLPPAVLNVVPGTGSEAGAALAGDPDISQLTFTGSVDIGVQVAKMAAKNVVPVVMELGGESPNVLFADAGLDLTIQGIANAIFQNTGQTCSAGSRLLVERSAQDTVVERLVAKTQKMRLGARVSDPRMGPIISKRQLKSIEDYVKAAKNEGTDVVAGGVRPLDPALVGGFYIQPTAPGPCRDAGRSGRNLWPGADGHDLRRRRGGRRPRKPHGVRPGRRDLDAGHQQGAGTRCAHQGRSGVHQHLRRGRRRGIAVLRLKKARIRAGEGFGVAVDLHAGQECLHQVLALSN